MRQTNTFTEENATAGTQRKRIAIYAFLAGSAISYVGDILTLIALPWFVLQTTGSVEQTGLTAFFSTLPMVSSAFLSSTIVDRLGYKYTSIYGDIASGVTVMLIPLLARTGGIAFWQILVLVFLGGLLKSPGVTARSAMTPDLARWANMPLERANALSDGVNRVSGFVGAPIAGLLIGIIGTSNLLWLDGISFFISALLIALAVPAVSLHRQKKDQERGYFATLWEGVSFIRRDALIATLIITVMITNLLDEGLISVVEPAYIKQTFQSVLPFSLRIAAFGGAAFVSTLIFSAIGHRLPRRWAFSIGFIIGGPLRFWVLLIPIVPVIVGWSIIAGLAIGPINAIFRTTLQERTPIAMRARVFGAVSAGALAGTPLGAFASGYLAAWAGLKTSLILMGAIYLLTTLSLLVNPALKHMRRNN